MTRAAASKHAAAEWNVFAAFFIDNNKRQS
jgi:hypothetical protein